MRAIYRFPDRATETKDLRPGWNPIDESVALHVFGNEVLALSNAARTPGRGERALVSFDVQLDNGDVVGMLPDRGAGRLHVLPVRSMIVRRIGGYSHREETGRATHLRPLTRAEWTERADGWLSRCLDGYVTGTAIPDLWHFSPRVGGAWYPYGPPEKDTPGGRGLDFCPNWERSFGWLAWRVDRMLEGRPFLNLDPATGEPLPPERTPIENGVYTLECGEPWNPGVINKATALPDWYQPIDPHNFYDDRRVPRDASGGAAGSVDYRSALMKNQVPNGQHRGRWSQLLRALAEQFGDEFARWALRCLAADCAYAYPLGRIKALAAGPGGHGSPHVAREFSWVRSCCLAAHNAGSARAGELAAMMGRAMRRVAMPNGLLQNWPGSAAASSGFSPFPWGDPPSRLGYEWGVAQVMEATIAVECAPDDVRDNLLATVFGQIATPWRVNGNLPHFLGVAKNGIPVSTWEMAAQGEIETTFCWHALGVGRLFDVMEHTFLPGTTLAVPRADLLDALVHNASTNGLNPREIEQTGAAIAALETR